MNTIGKILALASSLILLTSGISFLATAFGSVDERALDLTDMQVEQRTNSQTLNEMTRDIKDAIVDYNDFQTAKKNQLEGDLELIDESIKKLNTEIENVRSDRDLTDGNITLLEKQTELLSTAAETAIAAYFERKKKEAEALKPKDDDAEKKPDDVIEKPEDKKEDKPEDKVEEKPEEKKDNAEDSVILSRPKNLPENYFWPISSQQKTVMLNSVVFLKNTLFNYLKNKVEDDGSFVSFDKALKPFHHLGQNVLAYAIFAQETNSGSLENILKNIDKIRASSESKKILSTEYAFTILGLVYAKMKANSKITQTSVWEPLGYSESTGFNETEKKILEWAINKLVSRQTKSGGWSNLHVESEVIYDHDVITTALSMYALAHAYQAGFTDKIKEEMLINGLNYLLRMQNKQKLKRKCSILDNDGKVFENVNLRGWGFNYSAKPSLRTTALSVAAITKVMHVLRKISQKHDDIIKKCKASVVDGFAFIAEKWNFSEDFYTNWAVVQACATAGVSRIGKHDIYSEIMTFFTDRTRTTKINSFSFASVTFAYWSMHWCRQEQGFFKPMKIAGYEK